MTKDYSYSVNILNPIDEQLITDWVTEFKGIYVIEHSDFDSVISNLIYGAIQAVETFTNHILGLYEVIVSVSSCSGMFELPLLPVSNISISDSQDVKRFGKSHIKLTSLEPIEVTYNAGFDSEIPSDIKLVIFEYVNVLFSMEDSKITGLEKEQILKSILKVRLYKYKMDADVTALL